MRHSDIMEALRERIKEKSINLPDSGRSCFRHFWTAGKIT